MGSIPVAGAIKIRSTLAVDLIFIVFARRTHSASIVKRNWVRIIAPSFPVGSSQDGANSRCKSPLAVDLIFTTKGCEVSSHPFIFSCEFAISVLNNQNLNIFSFMLRTLTITGERIILNTSSKMKLPPTRPKIIYFTALSNPYLTAHSVSAP